MSNKDQLEMELIKRICELVPPFSIPNDAIDKIFDDLYKGKCIIFIDKQFGTVVLRSEHKDLTI
jgi:hypothetical protein